MEERGTFEREIRELGPWSFDRQVAATAQVNRVGKYSLRDSTGALAFWRVEPGAHVATGAGHVLFDLVIELTDDPVDTASIGAPQLATQVTGAAADLKGDLVMVGRQIRIAFAVAPNTGNDFRGKVRLTITRPGTDVTVDLPIAGTAGGRVDDLYAFVAVHTNAKQTYGWTTPRVVDAATPTTGVNAAGVWLELVRDNEQFKERRRGTTFTTNANGNIERYGRTKIALPTQWPFIVRASSFGFVTRSHFVRVTTATGPDNSNPFVPPSLPLKRRANVAIANKRILFDPGHGVVYNHEQRRSQEWFAAHKLVDEVIRQLTTFFGLPRANILLTRTAGFGLIEPKNVNKSAAQDSSNRPVFSDASFAFDLQNKKIRIAKSTRGLKDLSDLLLTTHTGNTNTAQSVPIADRTRLLTINAARIAAIETRLNASLGPKRRVQPGSIRWDAAADDYVYTREPVPGQTGTTTDQHLPITTTDLFVIDDAMLRVLADRSARWSLQKEIGKGPAASGSRPEFAASARDSMRAAGAVDYMRDKIMEYAGGVAASPPPAEFLTNGIKAWSPSARIDFINTVHADPARRCDLYLTVHLNAFSGVNARGTALLIDDVDTPPAQIRLAKIFLKYVDPLTHGLKSGGIVRGDAGMLNASNSGRDSFAYFETEFMTSVTDADPSRYNYADMIVDPYLSTTAAQLVNAIIEALEGPQTDLDSVSLRGNFATGSVTHW
jgi:hypothetical protein